MSKYKGGNCKCWRNCGEENANYTHIFYTCKIIQPYWKEVFQIVEATLGKKLDLKSEIIILGKIPMNISSKVSIFFKSFHNKGMEKSNPLD
uniref:Uncharacterized protein n=1 Tax=Neogobius melanostomus TaxID=47308 RepID=A0A8C6WIK6_9GOBI